jgi:hypothetical protein
MSFNLIRTVRVASCLGLVAFPCGSARAAASATTGSLLVGRYSHSATLLTDGRVLVAGGVGTNGAILAEAEIYDPATGMWTQTGSMAARRFNHQARLMEDGTVVVTGGSEQVASESFDPTTGKWSSAGSGNKRFGSKAAPPAGSGPAHLGSRTNSLQSGEILSTGGISSNNEALTEIAIFNPVANAWTKAGDMIEGRHPHTATELRDGRVLLAGGANFEVLRSAEVLALTPAPSGSSSISSNFNGTPIAGGDFIWFNSVLKPRGLASSQVTLRLQNSSIQFMANNTVFNLAVPDAAITFSPSFTTATASFDTSTHTWNIQTPSSGLAGNTFLDGLIFQVPAGGLPGGVKPVTWQGHFSTDTPGVTLQWQWAAAVYPAADFSADYNALGVKPVDDNKASIYQNSDHAGTPENFKCQNCLPGGATGGGGSNFTGSYSGTASVTPGTGGTVPATLVMQTENSTDLIWTAVTPGSAGNNLTLQFIWNLVPNTPLSVAVAGGVNIQVTLGTGPVGNLISTGSDIATLVNSTPATSALVTVTVVDGTFPESPFGPLNFTGGH